MRNSDHDELLSDVLEEAGKAPTLGQVMKGVRAEKSARRQRGTALVAVAMGCLAVVLSLVYLSPQRELDRNPVPSHVSIPATAPVASAPEVAHLPDGVNEPHPTPGRIPVTRINDEELMELLEGEPMALVNYPDGSAKLIILER